MGFVDREEPDRHSTQPFKGISGCEPFRRKIEQPIFAPDRLGHHTTAFIQALVTINYRRWNAHLRQLRRLILHQSDKRRYDYCRLLRNQRRKLVAQRLSASSRHHHAGVVRRQQAADNILLLGTKLVIAPVAPQYFRQIWSNRHSSQYSLRGNGGVCEPITPAV